MSYTKQKAKEAIQAILDLLGTNLESLGLVERPTESEEQSRHFHIRDNKTNRMFMGERMFTHVCTLAKAFLKSNEAYEAMSKYSLDHCYVCICYGEEKQKPIVTEMRVKVEYWDNSEECRLFKLDNPFKPYASSFCNVVIEGEESTYAELESLEQRVQYAAKSALFDAIRLRYEKSGTK